MEPWSIVANHPLSGDPFGLVVDDDSTLAEAEDLALAMLASFRLTGLFVPTSAIHPQHGHYLFRFTCPINRSRRLASIWAENLDDAELRLNILAADGILFMPTGG